MPKKGWPAGRRIDLLKSSRKLSVAGCRNGGASFKLRKLLSKEKPIDGFTNPTDRVDPKLAILIIRRRAKEGTQLVGPDRRACGKQDAFFDAMASAGLSPTHARGVAGVFPRLS